MSYDDELYETLFSRNQGYEPDDNEYEDDDPSPPFDYEDDGAPDYYEDDGAPDYNDDDSGEEASSDEDSSLPYDDDEDGGSQPYEDDSDDSLDDGEEDEYRPRSSTGKSRSGTERPGLPKLLIPAVTAVLAAVIIILLWGRRGTPPPRSTPAPAAPTAEQNNPIITAPPEPVHTENPQNTPAQIPPSQDAGGLYYIRGSLNAEEQALYDQISMMLAMHAPQTTLRCRDGDRALTLFRYVMDDHPEYFWADGNATCSYYEENGLYELIMIPTYTMTEEESDRMQQRLDAVTENLRRQFGSSSDYEKVKGVYEYIINHSIYDMGWMDQSLCTVLLEGHGVCASYARSTQYLLQQLGVQALYVFGEAGGGSHAWNVVRIDNDYYHLDTTWGDPIMENGEQILQYDYFCLTSDEMFLDHTLDPGAICPNCTAVTANYYRHEGRYFSSCDREAIRRLFERDTAARQAVRLRSSDAAVMDEIWRWLFDEAGVYEILEELETVGFERDTCSFSRQEQLNILQIDLVYS